MIPSGAISSGTKTTTGQARLCLDDRELIAVVVFVPEDAAPLIGATTLDLFGLGVDPVSQQLVPVNALLKSLV